MNFKVGLLGPDEGLFARSYRPLCYDILGLPRDLHIWIMPWKRDEVPEAFGGGARSSGTVDTGWKILPIWMTEEQNAVTGEAVGTSIPR